MENKRLRPKMVDELNKKLIRENSCLRYKEISRELGMVCYTLTVVDKYIDDSYECSVGYVEGFDTMVRDFFRERYGVENTGYSNAVKQIRAWEEDQ
ncbi:hypothetical protein UT300003_32570 [Clostridium sardiniense]